jgi:hypothetical protein
MMDNTMGDMTEHIAFTGDEPDDKPYIEDQGKITLQGKVFKCGGKKEISKNTGKLYNGRWFNLYIRCAQWEHDEKKPAFTMIPNGTIVELYGEFVEKKDEPGILQFNVLDVCTLEEKKEEKERDSPGGKQLNLDENFL